jgi:hypothetical protein
MRRKLQDWRTKALLQWRWQVDEQGKSMLAAFSPPEGSNTALLGREDCRPQSESSIRKCRESLREATFPVMRAQLDNLAAIYAKP